MNDFVVECYEPASAEAIAVTVADIGAACAEIRVAGGGVVYLGALLIPEDELAFHVFAAADAAAVLEVSRRAGLRAERVVPSVIIGLDRGQAGAWQALPVAAETERPVAHAPGEIGP